MVATNNRIFYACQMVGMAKMGTDTTMSTVTNLRDAHTVAHGVQSVGVTTNFNLEQAFELGQIQVYENIEGLPDVEVTMEKVLDGYPLLYHLATPSPPSPTLVGRGKERTDLSLGIYSDAFDSVTDSGNLNLASSTGEGQPQVEIFCSGMYVGSISYTIPVDGNATESITLQGNSKQWITVADNMHISSTGEDFGTSSLSASTDADEPKAMTMYSGGIQRRENVRLNHCIFPKAIYGMNGTGVGNAWNSTTDVPRVHMQNISVSTDFSREDIMELGSKSPYYRSPGFPLEVSCELEAIAISGDFISALETGDPNFWTSTHADYNLKGSGDNTSEEIIFIKLQDGTAIDLGKKNRLSSVSYGGGDAAGGNVAISYSYTNFNEFTILHPQDPFFSSYTSAQQLYTADAAPTYS
jgi:hypothetical protein